MGLNGGPQCHARINPGRAAPPASGSEGPDLAAFYEVSDAIDLGDDWDLTLSVTVFNNGAVDLTSAAVIFRDSSLLEYGSEYGVSISSGGSVLVEFRFTLPANEYQLWRDGVSPYLSVEFTDSDGNADAQVVDLAGVFTE